MEHQDNIFEQFKKAAETSETKDFPGLEKVWSRVDAKLDTQVYQAQKSTNISWKKFAVAASVVVGTVFAYQFLKEEKTIQSPQNTVVVNDSIADKITNDTTTAIVSSENEILLNKKEADKIIEKQLSNPNQVTVNEVAAATIEEKAEIVAPETSRPITSPSKDENDDAKFLRGRVYEARSVVHSKAEEVVEVNQNTESKKQASRKAAPLIVVDGKAVTDKNKADLEDVESIVELKNPLYIINGVEYSEKEVFGPNPTSPYYPLNKQEIESISIYKDEEAIEQFGKKGEEGVVVIKTKNGKPKTAIK